MDEPHLSDPSVSVRDGLVADLNDGLPKTHACKRAGIAPSTLTGWMDRGQTQVQRVLNFEAENPDALACDHRWDGDDTCTGCGAHRSYWDDLLATNELHAPFVLLLRDVGRAQADVVRDRIKAIVKCSTEARATAGDWRASAWLLERLDPKEFHLVTRADEAELDQEPEPVPEQVMAEVDAIAERYNMVPDAPA